MRIAVLGSWRQEDARQWKLREDGEQFAQACRRIGQELIRRGHSLIVGTDSRHTADGNAARGAYDELAEQRTDRPRITVVRQDDSSTYLAFNDQRRAHGGIFVDHIVHGSSWAAVKLVQTQLADAVLLVGGAEKTEQAGLTAAVARKPIACIGSFGGAASKLNQTFQHSPATWGYEPWETRRVGELQEPFSEIVLKSALEQAWIEGAPKLMIIHGRSPDRNLLKRYLAGAAGAVIVLADEFDPTQPIPIKLERFASSVDGAIALLTPDDVGGLADDPSNTASRARENVWVEVGWFWGRRGRSHLLLLRKGDVTIPSDLLGVEAYKYTKSPVECREIINKFISRLRAASEATNVG